MTLVVSHVVKRGLFTDLLLAYLTGATPAATNVVWGDGEAPDAGGWSGQEAGKGTFVPYVVLSTGTATRVPGIPDTLKGRNEAAWQLGYTIRGVGGSRSQCDFALDVVRPILGALHKQTYAAGQGSEVFKVLKSEHTQLGAVIRNDETDPSTYECVDALAVWVEKV